jgi:regulatory protein
MADSTLYKTALSKAMAICSRSEHCTDDIRLKLQLWGVGETDIIRIISELTRENFINEKRYAEAFVKDKFRYNKWGKVKIRANLKLKKLPVEMIGSALDSIDDDLYKKTLADLLASRRRSVKAKNQYDLKGKLLRYGLSKGFESDLLYNILSGEFENPDHEGHEGDQEND